MKIALFSGLGACFMLASVCGFSQENRPARPGTNRGAPAEPLNVRLARADAQPIPGMLPARLSLTVYEVETPTNQPDKLDAGTLAKEAGTAEMLLKALATAGKAQLLYHLDQPVNVFSETITVGTSEPVITSTHVTEDGHAINSISYVNLGLIVRLSAQAAPQDGNNDSPGVDMSVQTQTPPQGDIDAETGQPARPMLGAKLEHNEPLEFNHPLLMVSAAETMVDRRSNRLPAPFPSVRYVVRYEFSKPAMENFTAAATSGAVAESSPATVTTTNSDGQAVKTLPAQFQAAIYTLQIAPDRINSLDVQALIRRAGSAESLRSALAEFGEPRLVYDVNREVNVFSYAIDRHTNEQFITSVTVSAHGTAIFTPVNQQTGFAIRLSAQPPPGETGRNVPNLRINLSGSTVVPSDIDLDPGHKASATRTLSLTHTEPLEFDRPQVMLAVRSVSATELNMATVYVVRYLFNPPTGKEPPTGTRDSPNLK